MHGLIFETSVWLLAESTRLITTKTPVAEELHPRLLYGNSLRQTPNVLKPSLLAPPPTTSFQTVQEKTPRLSLLARSQGTHAQAVQENPKAISLLARPPTTDVQAVQENTRKNSSNLERDCPSLFRTEDLSNHEPATIRTSNSNRHETPEPAAHPWIRHNV